MQEGKTLAAEVESANPVRNWAVGSAAGAMTVAACVYGAVWNVQEGIENRSPGSFVEAIGYAAGALAASGAAKEAFRTFWQRYDESRWHYLVPNEEHTA